MEKTRTIEKNEEKQPKTPKQMALFVLKIVGNVVFYGVILLLFIYSLMNINAKRKHGIPNIFGKGYLVVLTDSMTANPDALPEQYKDYKIKQFSPYIEATETTKAYKGDLVNVDMISQSQVRKLKVGDVITYWDPNIKLSDGTEGAYNTHRIVWVHDEDSDGKIDVIYTIGDHDVALYGLRDYDNMSDSDRLDYETNTYLGIFGESNFSSIKAKVTSVNYGGGYTVTWIQNHWLGVFIIPIAIILVVEIILVIKNVLDLRREKNKKEDKLTHEQQMAELQSEKERMRAELLAELRSQGVITEEAAPAAVAVEEASEAPVEETKDEIATDTKEDAPVEVEAEEIKEEQPEEVKEEPVVEEAPQEETKSEENIEAVEENKGEEEPVVEETKEEAEASNLNISLEENEEEKPVKKTTAKKTSSKKKKDE